jgi:hypothetical protein
MTASLKLTPLTPLFYHKKKEIASFFCNKKARDYRLFGLFVRILSLKIYGVNVERRETKVSKILAGARGSGAVDTDMLVSCLAALAQLVEANPSITEMDINPLLVQKNSIVALDVRIALG